MKVVVPLCGTTKEGAKGRVKYGVKNEFWHHISIPPRQIPLCGTAGNPTPRGKTCSLNLSRAYAAGQNCFVCLIGDVGRKRNRVLFCFGRNGNGAPKGQAILRDIPLSRYPYPLLPHPHLAGTQTALPSVPVPTKVSFVADPAPFLDSKTFFPGKKVLACFLCTFLFTRKESWEKTPYQFYLSTKQS